MYDFFLPEGFSIDLFSSIAKEYLDVMTEVEFLCDMEPYDLEEYDYDDSCRVDLPDLVEIVEKWLQNYLVYFD